MSKTYYLPEKRLDTLPHHTRENIVFDLVNAFALVKGSKESAMLLQDLLTRKELSNLAKRLRIAKELLAGTKQEEIVRSLHCGFGVIARVQMWLAEGGEGLRKIISRLPRRRQYPQWKTSTLPSYYRTPEAILTYIQQLQANKETEKLKQLLKEVDEKAASDRMLRKILDEYYRDRNLARKAR